VIGIVAEWHDRDGWGVLTTPDGHSVWCHYSQVEMTGYRTLVPGRRVEFDYETPGQDGFDARVLTTARPVE
jgi:CspA family cold shock protein